MKVYTELKYIEKYVSIVINIYVIYIYVYVYKILKVTI